MKTPAAVNTQREAIPLDAFFSSLFPDSNNGFVELRALPSLAQSFFRPRDLSGISKFVETHRDQNLYFGVASRRTRKSGRSENCYAVRCLYCDIDFKTTPEAEARPRLDRFPIKPSIVVQSGGGLHVYWLLKEPLTLPEDKDRLVSLLRRLAAAVGADLSSAEPARVLRVPGTLNRKPEYDSPRPVVIERLTTEAQYNIADFDDLLQAELESDGKIAGERIPKDTRNSSLTSLAGAMRRHGTTESEISDALLSVNANRCDPPLSEKEVRGIAKSVSRYAPGRADQTEVSPDGKGVSKPLALLPARDFIERPLTNVGNIIDGGNLPRSGKLLAVAAGGVGKSLLAGQLSLSLSTGGAVLGTFQITEPQRVGLFPCEDPEWQTQDRMRRQSRGMGLQKPPDGLFVFGREEPLLFGGPGGTPYEESIARLVETIRRLALSVVIFDPLIALHEARENENSDMARWLYRMAGALQKEGCAVIITHHVTWAHDGESHSRGASAIQNWADTVWNLREVKGKGRTGIKLSLDKINFGPRWAPLLLTLDPDTLLFQAARDEGGLCPVPDLLQYLRDVHGGVFRGRKTDLYNLVRNHFGCGDRTVREAFHAAISHNPPLLKDLGRRGGFEVTE